MIGQEREWKNLSGTRLNAELGVDTKMWNTCWASVEWRVEDKILFVIALKRHDGCVHHRKVNI